MSTEINREKIARRIKALLAKSVENGATEGEAMAAALEEKLDTGDVDAWIEIRNVELAQLPNEICDLCEGTGIRTDEIGRKMGQPDKVIGTNTPPEPNRPRYGEKGWCNGCNGKGWNPAFAKSYEVDRNDVEEFVAFLKECGGFEIC